MNGAPDGRSKSDPEERQIFYEVDLEASRSTDRLVVQASQRQRRAGGQWGKIKPLKVRPGELDHIEHEDDRTFLSYLAGAIPERANWSTQQAELRTSAHRFQIPFELGQLLLPDMCRSRRLRILGSDEAGEQLLEWDSGEPWELTIRVRRDTDSEGWRVVGLLVRNEESLELADVPLVISGGFVVTNDSIALLRDFGAPNGCGCWQPADHSPFPKTTSTTSSIVCSTFHPCPGSICPKNCNSKKSAHSPSQCSASPRPQ
ncbi:MAG UNVERIFIED_CONTAM: hypothetical protein LVR18_08390 [Planctomycetaceae bacterium]|jgi:hypothetical protein